ncbi:MAG: single-stranded-DNA-specific exonuclease RecJ [Planctomycetes bacterium]|nr:single-stranded-DNA-specific exonuclease RecJ [Planctomycetota bacterium]
MPTLQTRAPLWRIQTPDPAHLEDLVQKHGVSRLVASLLANRGHRAGQATASHLEPNLQDLADPMALPDMELACERLERAIRDGEMILVHGDYDVDGVTGTTLLVRLFQHLGARVSWHIPSRFDDGYSFGEHSLRKAEEVGARVVISVDNGTSSVETIGALKAMGIDTIVTDHHEPPKGDLPAAVAIVNPKLETSTYPFRELCGAAVAFKLAWGLCQRISGSERVRDDLRQFLVDSMGLVAIATVCDVVPLENENRILCQYGLKALGASRAPGFQALLEVTNLTGRTLCAEDVAFQVGPRINAAGRLETAARAVEVFLAPDLVSGRNAARRLDDLNIQRRELERELTELAMAQAEPFAQDDDMPVILVGGQGWHQGVIGIVASRLVDRFGKPALVFGFDGDEGRGSARSVPGFSILEAMHAGAEFMGRYGGHEQAAGCDLSEKNLPALREAINREARRILEERPLNAAHLEIDADVPFENMVEAQMRQIDRLEPFGSGNGAPVLLSRDLRLADSPRRIGADGSHLMFQVRQGNVVHKALFFGAGARASELAPARPVHLVYTPRWNTFRGETSLQLVVKDMHCGDRLPLAPAR